jgi:IS4 transposase
MVAAYEQGRTVADLLAHGFTNTLLDRLARDGLATIQPGTMHAGTRRITVVWVTITDAGQRALADNLGWPVG